ncbi:sensor histidine kinase [Streptomyces longispororuber]|uniref:sensor histidine kinase n=1 Tax=Streptomyces longispororuber TaxID=68230 RepID=UPI0036F4D30F
MKRLRRTDWLLPGGLFAVLVLNIILVGPDSGARPMWPWGWVLTVAGCSALVGRRLFPLAVVIVTGLAANLYYPAGYPDTCLAFTFLIAMHTLTGVAGRLQALLATFAVVAGFVVVGRARGSSFADDGEAIAVITAMLILVVIIGEVQRGRAEAVTRAEAAERTREEEARRRTAEERLRIARELHDVLAHRISLINVQAGAALHRREPELAFTALENVKTASKETLVELRGVLGVLRQYDEAASVAPVPGLAELPGLIERAGHSGLRVRFTGEDTGDVSAAAGLAAYRIVQEALTNCVRHAGASEVVVRLTREPRSLVVEVTDDGHGGDGFAEGNGLSGMRERAAGVGGTLTAGPGPRGFRVRAELPVQ